MYIPAVFVPSLDTLIQVIDQMALFKFSTVNDRSVMVCKKKYFLRRYVIEIDELNAKKMLDNLELPTTNYIHTLARF